MIKTIPTSILLFFLISNFAQLSIKVVYDLIIGYNSGFSYNQELTNMLINAEQLNEDLSDSLYFDKDKSYFEINEQPINTRKYFTFSLVCLPNLIGQVILIYKINNQSILETVYPNTFSFLFCLSTTS